MDCSSPLSARAPLVPKRIRFAPGHPQEAVVPRTPRSRAASKKRGAESQLVQWLSALGAALPIFLLNYSSCVSYSQLVVMGSPASAQAVTAMHLVGSAISGIVLPLRSRCPLVLASADISVAIFYQRVVQDIVWSAHGVPEDEVAATILLALPVTTVLMSLILFAVGKAQVTAVVAYLPYPVVAGFLGTVAWKIFSGSFAVLSGGAVHPPWLVAVELPWQFACMSLLGLVPAALRQGGVSSRLLAVGPTLVALASFWLWAACAPQAARERWLFPREDAAPFWTLWTGQDSAAVRWSLLPPRLTTFAGLGCIMILSLTLRIAGIQESTGVALSSDDEVMRTGAANIFGGACGAVIGSHSPGMTTFNKDAGSSDCRPALLTACLTLLVWLSGVPVIAVLPRFLLAGILMNLGFGMLLQWLWESRTKIGWLGLLVVYAQVASSVYWDLQTSVLVGVVIACVTAQVRIMRQNVVKYHLSARSIRSPTRRTEPELAVLKLHDREIEAIALDGDLSEGPMLKFRNYITEYVRHSDVRYMILDFTFCKGANASACSVLAKLLTFLEDKAIALLFVNMKPSTAATLKMFGVKADDIYEGESLHDALDRCERGVLASHWGRSISFDMTKDTLAKRLQVLSPHAEEGTLSSSLARQLGCTAEEAADLASRGSWSTCRFGDHLAAQGVRSQTVYFAAPGYSKVLETMDFGMRSGAHRIAMQGLGAICGLESLLQDEPCRSNFIVHGEGSRVLSVPAHALRQLATDSPAIYAKIVQAAALQLLQRGDALGQAVELNKCGSWRGPHFDRSTAMAATPPTQLRNGSDGSPRSTAGPDALERLERWCQQLCARLLPRNIEQDAEDWLHGPGARYEAQRT